MSEKEQATDSKSSERPLEEPNPLLLIMKRFEEDEKVIAQLLQGQIQVAETLGKINQRISQPVVIPPSSGPIEGLPIDGKGIMDIINKIVDAITKPSEAPASDEFTQKAREYYMKRLESAANLDDVTLKNAQADLALKEMRKGWIDSYIKKAIEEGRPIEGLIP